MKDSQDFGKVQTYEELRMLRELELYYKKHPLKSRRKYSRQVVLGGASLKRVVVNLEDNRVVVGARKDMSYRETVELLGEGLVAAVSSAGMDSDVVLDWLEGRFEIEGIELDAKGKKM